MYYGVALTKKAYRAAMEEMPATYPDVFVGVTDPLERDRKARNLLSSRKVWEVQGHGPLSDVRELVALRIAPWLHR